MASYNFGVFFWKAYQTKPCQNFPAGQPAKSGKYYQQINQTFEQNDRLWPPLSHLA